MANVIGFQGILQYKVADKGASFGATDVEPIVSSTDPNFRPSDIKVGPDGAVWFIDWHNPIIGHLQHAIRDPNRDRTHGRIYRVTYEGRPLSRSPAIAGEPVEKLLELLKEPEDRVRYRARSELGARDSAAVLTALAKWAAGLDKSDPDYEHHMLEALWLHQAHNVVNQELLKRALSSPDFRARAAATRVLCYWRDRVPEALELLKKQAADEHARVRLEAVRAASFFTAAEAIEIPLISAERASDVYLDYVRAETLKALDPYVKKAIAEGKQIAFTSAAGARFFLKNVSTDDLLKMKRTEGVFIELLFRKGVRDEHRREALTGLAKLKTRSEVQVLVEALRNQDEQQNKQDESVVFDLIRVLTGKPAAELTQARPEILQMAAAGKTPTARQLGYVALIAADGKVDGAWAVATKSAPALLDLVRAMPLVRDPGQRAALYPKVEPLLNGLPAELAAAAIKGSTTLGRFVRIELPGRQRTLTVAEVEVFSGGKNVARQGKASQKNTAFNGDAAKAIDGNKSGKFGDGGQTHTQENTPDPWWEVDLGGEMPVEAVVIYNRTDGDLGARLKDFTLKVLDKDRKVVFERTKQPAPDVQASFALGSPPLDQAIRQAAMLALTAVRGQEAHTFKALTRFLKDDADRHAALQALQRIPVIDWPKDEAKPLLDVLLPYIRNVPFAERTAPAVLDALQFADALASLLPLNDARTVRKELGELGVRVIRMATIPDQMLFDKDKIVVRAGKPFEILFENNDLMPHNLVITEPGALEEIGNLAEAGATQPGAMERHYVPVSKKILASSRLLQPREVQKLSLTAPAKPGVYPVVCTYPGHWRRMYAAMYVVEDLDEYQAEPESYLAKHPLPAADELLKFIRPRKEWTFAELAPAVEQLAGGRSFSNGKQMFRVGACVSCHKLNGEGNEIGPDLTKTDPKWKPADILRDVLEPSFRIDEKYVSWVFETNAGKIITGMILEETPQTVKVIENPLAKAEPVILKKADIASRQKSPVSIMPKGLLDKFTREEILDLLAYVIARGEAKHKYFQGDHDHKHGH